MQTNKARIPPQTAALLRCVQKDDEYQRLLLNENNDIFQRLFGIRKWLKFRKEIECLSKFTYFAITTLTGVQTLGEEYVDIVQVHGDKLIVPSFNRRLMMILLQTTTPYIIEKTIAHLIKLVEDPNVRMVPEILNDTEIRLNLIEILPKFKKVIEYINHCHLVLFYFFGTYYNLSKRMTRIKYTAFHAWLSNGTSRWLYKLLGSLTLFQLVLSILFQYYSVSITLASERVAQNALVKKEAINPQERCSLCLSKRNNSTATPCGHLFCWNCIGEWIQIKGECPLCRESVQPFQLVFLQNYD